MFRAFIASLIFSLILGVLLLKFKQYHKKFTGDYNIGPQKHHKNDAIRIGGVVIFFAMLVGLGIGSLNLKNIEVLLIAIASTPVFVAGLVEDLTKQVSPKIRLFSAAVSSLLGMWLLDAYIYKIDMSFIDSGVFAFKYVAYGITLLAVTGTTHAFNIIDGHNGLSGMISLLILAGICYLCLKLNDYTLATICVVLMGSITGFLFWNFPKGHIFAGDSGAYLMGFTTCQLSIWLTKRHSEVSPWFTFLLLLYPVFETLFSMYRRKFIQSRSISRPDSLHLHSIIYKRMVRWVVGKSSDQARIQASSMTSPYLWIISLTTVIPAILFYNSTLFLILFSGLYFVMYIWIYRKIVRFRKPKYFDIYRYKIKTQIKNHDFYQ